MVSLTKIPLALAALMLPVLGATANAAPAGPTRALSHAMRVQAAAAPQSKEPFRIVVIRGKDVSGRIYKKLGLPSVKYCWDICTREAQCTGTRWGVILGDVAGVCQLLSGELTVKESARLTTEDGKAIQVIAGRKQAGAPSDGGT